MDFCICPFWFCNLNFSEHRKVTTLFLNPSTLINQVFNSTSEFPKQLAYYTSSGLAEPPRFATSSWKACHFPQTIYPLSLSPSLSWSVSPGYRGWASGLTLFLSAKFFPVVNSSYHFHLPRISWPLSMLPLTSFGHSLHLIPPNTQYSRLPCFRLVTLTPIDATAGISNTHIWFCHCLAQKILISGSPLPIRRTKFFIWLINNLL